MKKLIFFVLAMPVMLMLSACGSDDVNDNLPSMTDKDDVCTAMDDLKFMKWCYDNYDVNGDGKVSKTEAAAVREFTPIDYPFTSIKGLEYFTGIEKLTLRGTFSDINLSLMTNLKHLSVEANVKTFDLSKNPHIKYLWIHNKDCNNSSYTLENPTNIIIGFEKLDNPSAFLFGIVRMNEINLITSKAQLPEKLIVKNLTISNSQKSRHPNNGQIEVIKILGDTYYHFINGNIYWQTIHVIGGM